MRKFLQFTLSLLAMLMVTLNANAWKFTSVTPAAGEVESISSISVAWEGDGWLYEMGAVQCTVTGPDGASYTFNLSNQMPNEVSGSEASFKTLSDPGTYTLTIPAGAFHYSGGDWLNPTKGEGNEEFTVTWTINDPNGGGQQGGGEQGGGTVATPWTFKSVTPAIGEVKSLKTFTFKMEDADNTINYNKAVTLKKDDGTTYSATIKGNILNGGATITLTNEVKDPGTYTLEIPEGLLEDSKFVKNAAMSYKWTIPGGSDQGGGSDAKGWTFTSVTPEQGEVKAEDLELIVFEMPQSVGGANEIIDLNLVDQDGTTYKYKFSDNFGGAIHANYVGEEGNEPSKAGTYTLTIPASSFTSFMDETTNAAMTYTWTVKASTPPAPTYTVSYDKVNNLVQVKWPEGTTIKETDEDWGVSATIDGYPVNGGVWSVANAIDFYPNISEGDHTLNIAAGQFTINGTANEALSAKFTVSSGSQGGGGHDFDGQPWHEQIFKAGETTVSTPVSFKTDGVEIATESGQTSVGTVEFRYNLYEENELDWMNGTKIIITAKQDVNKIILIPTASGKDAIAYATAVGGDGEYNNGVWEGKLNAGETLTLTSNDGTQIKGIYVCYNGDDFDPADADGDDKGVITVQWPVVNQAINKITDGGTLAKFTTNKQYAYVTVELRNVNDKYHNKYDLPMRYMDGLAAGEQTCTASTPGTSSTGGNPAWIPYNGDAFELIIKGYVNYWDNDYDAIAVVPVRGESAKEHEPESNETLVKITPTTATELSMDIPKAQVTNLRDNTITFEFSGKISKFNATRCGSLMAGLDALKLVTKQIDEDGKIWTVTIPKDDILNNFQPHEDYNFEITAYDAEGAVLLLNDYRADNALAVIYEVTDQDISEDDVKTLGTPAFSIEDGADNVPATTESILVTFPEAKGFGSNVVAKVSGTLTCRDMSTPVEFDDVEGTLANGVSVPVELSNDKGYSFTITSVALSEKTTVEGETFNNPIGTYKGNWSIIFYVGEGQGGNTGDNILGEATFTAGKDGITVAWPNAELSNIEGGAASFGEWTLTHNGQDYYIYPELTYDLQDGLSVEIPYTKIAVWDETIGEWGDYVPVELSAGDEITVSIPANEGVYIWEDYDNWGPMIYSNAEAISATVKVPSNEPAGILGEPTVSIENNTLKIEFDAPENVEGASLATAGVMISVGGVEYYGNVDEAFAENGKIVVEVPLSSTMEMENFDSYSPQVGDELSITIVEPEVYANYSDGSWEKVWAGDDITCSHTVSTTSGINNIAAGSANDKMYNVAGQQIKVAKGIVIKNGKKMFVK